MSNKELRLRIHQLHEQAHANMINANTDKQRQFEAGRYYAFKELLGLTDDLEQKFDEYRSK